MATGSHGNPGIVITNISDDAVQLQVVPAFPATTRTFTEDAGNIQDMSTSEKNKEAKTQKASER